MTYVLRFCVLSSLMLLYINSQAQHGINWTEKQLQEPAALANAISIKKDVPILISVGPGATIPNSIEVGMVDNPKGLQKLKYQLDSLNKNDKIVIYCGCCPFEHCPNVRPAINMLSEMNFTNYYLLNLPHNIKKDWIDKGYPVSN